MWLCCDVRPMLVLLTISKLITLLHTHILTWIHEPVYVLFHWNIYLFTKCCLYLFPKYIPLALSTRTALAVTEPCTKFAWTIFYFSCNWRYKSEYNQSAVYISKSKEYCIATFATWRSNCLHKRSLCVGSHGQASWFPEAACVSTVQRDRTHAVNRCCWGMLSTFFWRVITVGSHCPANIPHHKFQEVTTPHVINHLAVLAAQIVTANMI